MGRAVDFLTIIRPVNSVMVGFAVVVGVAVTTPVKLLSTQTVLGFLTGFFISSYSMVVNDYYDLEVDRINSPNRPLPSGAIRLGAAAVYAGLMLVLGLASSMLLGWVNFVLAAVFAAVAWIYNYRGKRWMLLGNMMVAASVAIPYIYGGAAVGGVDTPLLWFLAFTSFLASTGREVVKTISDVEGDEARGVNSVARVYGSRVAALVGATFFLAAVASTLLPIVTGRVGVVFSTLILIPDILFVYAALRIASDYAKGNALRVKRLTLTGMVIGMLVFILGGVYGD